MRVELAARAVVDAPLRRLPFCRTRASRSSGSSDARVFASSIAPLAWREKASLFRSAYSAAPDAGRSSHRVVRFVEWLCLPSAAFAISVTRSA